MNEKILPIRTGPETRSAAAARGTPASDQAHQSVRHLSERFTREPELILACLAGIERRPLSWRRIVWYAADAACQKQPRYADLHYYASQAALAAGQSAAAMAHLRAALQINPDYMDALILAARIALLDGRPQIARTYLEQAQARGADYADVHMLLGAVWLQEGNQVRARAEYARALALNDKLSAARRALDRLPADAVSETSYELPA
jgi:tetratricopeptide (TPR) repeat protein